MSIGIISIEDRQTCPSSPETTTGGRNIPQPATKSRKTKPTGEHRGFNPNAKNRPDAPRSIAYQTIVDNLIYDLSKLSLKLVYQHGLAFNGDFDITFFKFDPDEQLIEFALVVVHVIFFLLWHHKRVYTF